MNNSLGKTQVDVSAEQPIEGLGPQGGESLRAVELGTCKPFDKVRWVGQPLGWPADKNAHAQWEQQVARRTTRIALVVQRLDRVGEIEEVDGVYAETEIEELAERKLRFDHRELAQPKNE
jgi:hypothetical protein